MYYPNIHTHHPAPRAILNISEAFDHTADGIYSMGLHPWFLKEETLDVAFRKLSDQAILDTVWAIGECGLDKVCATTWSLQEHAFIAQLELANTIRKPLVLHVVRAFSEVEHLLKVHGVKVPVIFHGFSKSLALAQQLIGTGYYLSFGKNLFSPQKAEVFRQLPLGSVFLETDSEEYSIDKIYARAAEIKQLPLQELMDQIEQNVRTVFGKSL